MSALFTLILAGLAIVFWPDHRLVEADRKVCDLLRRAGVDAA